MICYLPALRVITVSGVAAWLLWHKAIMHILGVAGTVLEITVGAAVAVAVAVLVIWLTRAIQRRRAHAGGCTGCRFRCQLAMTGPAAPRRREVAMRRPGTGPRVVAGARAVTGPRRAAGRRLAAGLRPVTRPAAQPVGGMRPAAAAAPRPVAAAAPRPVAATSPRARGTAVGQRAS